MTSHDEDIRWYVCQRICSDGTDMLPMFVLANLAEAEHQDWRTMRRLSLRRWVREHPRFVDSL